MTLALLTREETYDGDGVTVAFAITWQFFDATDVGVWYRDADAVETSAALSDFTISGGNGATGTATFNVAPIAGIKVVLRGQTPSNQLAEYPDGGKFPSKAVERSLDRQAAVSQENKEAIGDTRARALMVPPGDTIGLAPARDARKGMLLGFDDTGELLATASYVEIVDAAASAGEDRRRAEEAAQQAAAIVIGGRPIKTVTNNYTLQDADLNFIVRMDATSEKFVEFTPAAYRDGWFVDVVQYGPGAIYIKRADDIEITSKHSYDEMDLQGGVFQLVKVSATEGLAWGDLTGIYTPAPPSNLSEPWFDGFSGTVGTNLSGRTSEKGQGTWSLLSYGVGANINAGIIQLNGTGGITGLHGNSPPSNFVVAQLTHKPRFYQRRKAPIASFQSATSAASGFWNVSHVTVVPNSGSTAGLGAIAFRCTGASGVAQSLVWNLCANGVVGSPAPSLGTFFQPTDGCSFDFEEYDSGVDRHVITYMDGRQVGPDINLSQSAGCPPLTYNYGYRGNFSGAMDLFMTADPEVDGYLRSFCPNYVQQREDDGGLTFRPHGFLSTQDPLGLNYKIVKASDGSTVTDWSAVGGYNAEANATGFDWSGLVPTIDAPDAGGYTIQFQRTDIVKDSDGTTPSTVESNVSPIRKAGDVVYWTGQSLAAIPLFNTTGGAAGAPTDCYFIHGTIGQGTGTAATMPNPYQRRQNKVTANSALATFEAASAQVVSARPRCHIIGAQGDTYQSDRVPGMPQHAAQLDGIEHAGSDFGSFISIGGQYEAVWANDDLVNSYMALLDAELNSCMAVSGRPVLGQLVPLTPLVGGNDARCEKLKKLMWLACQSQPDRYFYGAPLFDMDSDGTSPYHFSTPSVHRQMQRLGWVQEFMMGRTVKDLRGPTLDHVTVDSATQCTVYVNNGSADTVDLINASAKGDHRGGLRFSTGPDFSALIVPTGHTVGSPSGGKTPIAFTFAAGTLSGGHVYVGGPYGAEPFNPDKLADVRASYSTMASMIVGNYTSPTAVVPIQPYYQVAGGDFISA